MAIAATIVSAIAALGGVLFTILIVWFWGEFGDDVRDCSSPTLTQQQQQQCIEDRIDDRFHINSNP
jgi:hypothetical protein